jgi:hypothetical protein
MKKDRRVLRLCRKYQRREGGLYDPQPKDVVVPWLNLNGRWLEEAGFMWGDYVSIHVSKEKLVIEKLNPNSNGATGN